jgi:hypothetical protein
MHCVAITLETVHTVEALGDRCLPQAVRNLNTDQGHRTTTASFIETVLSRDV